MTPHHHKMDTTQVHSGILHSNMEQEIKTQLEAQNKKLEAIFESVEKTRKYFLIVMWATVLMFVLPAIALVFVIPAFISTYTSSLEGLI